MCTKRRNPRRNGVNDRIKKNNLSTHFTVYRLALFVLQNACRKYCAIEHKLYCIFNCYSLLFRIRMGSHCHTNKIASQKKMSNIYFSNSIERSRCMCVQFVIGQTPNEVCDKVSDKSIILLNRILSIKRLIYVVAVDWKIFNYN